MNDAKGISVVVLSVMCIVLFVAFLSSAVGLQKQRNAVQEEITKRMNAEEQLQKISVEDSAIKSEFGNMKTALDEANKALEQEKMTSQALRNELEREKLLTQKLQDDLKEALAGKL